MIPASTAKQSVSAKKLDTVLLENVKEILRVYTAVPRIGHKAGHSTECAPGVADIGR